MTVETFGTLAVIDMEQRDLAGTLEVCADRDSARRAMRRSPDVDDEHMISWGGITREEAIRVISIDDESRFRADLLEELDEILSRRCGYAITLYFGLKCHG